MNLYPDKFGKKSASQAVNYLYAEQINKNTKLIGIA